MLNKGKGCEMNLKIKNLIKKVKGRKEVIYQKAECNIYCSDEMTHNYLVKVKKN